MPTQNSNGYIRIILADGFDDGLELLHAYTGMTDQRLMRILVNHWVKLA